MPIHFRILLGFLIIFSLVITQASANTTQRLGKPQKKFAPTKPSYKKAYEKKKKINKSSKEIRAKAVFCINLRNNQVLIARNHEKQLPIASLTKLVTALVALEKMPLDQKIIVPDHIKEVPKSVIGLKPGDSVSVGDLLHGLLIASANDCAETLAHAYPGGKKNFIMAMNKKVQSLGIKQTKFYTPSGLDRKKHDSEKKSEEVACNVSTAKEMAIVAKEAFSNNTIRSICQKKSYTIASSIEKNGYVVKTTNKLLRDNLPLVGGKTGYTIRAGHCLVTEFKPGRNTILIVVLGSPNHFRDTRLAYHKALKEANRIKVSANSSPYKRIVSEKYTD